MGLQVDFWSPKMQNVFLKPSQNASEIPFPPGVSPYLRRVSKFPRPVPFAKPIGGCPEITNFTQISHGMISGTITRYPWFHMIWNYVLWNRVCWGYRFHTLWKKQENHEIVTISRHSTIWDEHFKEHISHIFMKSVLWTCCWFYRGDMHLDRPHNCPDALRRIQTAPEHSFPFSPPTPILHLFSPLAVSWYALAILYSLSCNMRASFHQHEK